jgi:DNA repair exonuclease SbcCD ATPase subunit
MKPLLVMLLLATSVQAQSIADAARQERERQAKVKSTMVFKETGPPPAPVEEKVVPKANTPSTPDPLALWNARVDELRAKIKDLQEQEIALQLQQTQLQNQVSAPIIDPAAKEQAQNDVAQNMQQLAKVREDLDTSRKELDALQALGPPKKPEQAPK